MLAWLLNPECLAVGDSSTKGGENLKVLTGGLGPGCGEGMESAFGHPPPCAAEALRFGEVTGVYQFCFNSVITACWWEGWLLRPQPPPRIRFVFVRLHIRTLLRPV